MPGCSLNYSNACNKCCKWTFFFCDAKDKELPKEHNDTTTIKPSHDTQCTVYKEILDKIDLKDIANQFVQGNEHRLTIFGTF